MFSGESRSVRRHCGHIDEFRVNADIPMLPADRARKKCIGAVVGVSIADVRPHRGCAASHGRGQVRTYRQPSSGLRARRGRHAQRETYLVGDIRPCVRDVPTRLGEDALVVVAVEEGILDFALAPVLPAAVAADAVRLQARLLEDHEQSPPVRRGGALGYVRLDGEHVRVRGLVHRVLRGGARIGVGRHLASVFLR